ncbi:DedA family protein [Prochlorococcus sp. MIT 0916]|uniref:DedA family n=1 Tax=Prochlorococcus marinus str. P0903-H212 TaxID=1622208 RepID=A0A0D5A3Y9_PROMR|nr:DedA family [Prochlorococcus marinus str. P0903-H212]
MEISEFISSLPLLIGNAVETNQLIGYGAILIAMLLENLIPPIPSELIMPLGGFYVSQGQLDFLPVVLAGLIGTVMGALPWYGIGRLVNETRLEKWLEKNGRWIGINAQELARSRKWFNKYGVSLVFWGRLIPGIRTLISVPAGVELMPVTPFLVWTTAGSLIWTLFLTITGFYLGDNYAKIEIWISPFSSVFKTILILIISGALITLIYKTLRKLINN